MPAPLSLSSTDVEVEGQPPPGPPPAVPSFSAADIEVESPPAPHAPLTPALPTTGTTGQIKGGQMVLPLTAQASHSASIPAIPASASTGEIRNGHAVSTPEQTTAAPTQPQILAEEPPAPKVGPAFVTDVRPTPQSMLREPSNREVARQAGEQVTNKIVDAAPFLVGPFRTTFAEAPGHAVQGTGELAGAQSLKDAASGAGHLLQAGFEAATPAIGAGAVSAPLQTAVGLAAGVGAAKGTTAGLEHLGVAPEYADLAGDIAGIAAGYGLHGVAGWWLNPKVPPEVRALAEAASSPGASGNQPYDAELVDKLTRMASQTDQSPREAAIARDLLRRKYGINIPETPVSPEPVPMTAQPTAAPEPAPEPKPTVNTQAFAKARKSWSDAQTGAVTKFMEDNPGVSYEDALAAVEGTYGQEPHPRDFAAVPEPPEPPPPPPPPPEPEPPPQPTKVDRVSPATPNPPTAALPTEPESPQTMALQVSQAQQGTRRVVMFPKGAPPDYGSLQGLSVTNDGMGNIYAYRPDLIKKAEIHAAARNNKLPELLGSVGGMGAPDKSELQGTPIAVVGKAPDGTEAQSTVTTAEHLPTTVAATHAATPPGGTVEVKTPEDALEGRTGGIANPPSPPPAGFQDTPMHPAPKVEGEATATTPLVTPERVPVGWDSVEGVAHTRHPSVDLTDDEIRARSGNAPLPAPPGSPESILPAWNTVSRILPDLARKVTRVAYLPHDAAEHARINVHTGALWIHPSRQLTTETLWHELIHLDQPEAQAGRNALEPDAFNSLEAQARAGISDALKRFNEIPPPAPPSAPKPAAEPVHLTQNDVEPEHGAATRSPITAKTRLSPDAWREVFDDSLRNIRRLAASGVPIEHFRDEFSNLLRSASEIGWNQIRGLPLGLNDATPDRLLAVANQYAARLGETGAPTPATPPPSAPASIEEPKAEVPASSIAPAQVSVIDRKIRAAMDRVKFLQRQAASKKGVAREKLLKEADQKLQEIEALTKQKAESAPLSPGAPAPSPHGTVTNNAAETFPPDAPGISPNGQPKTGVRRITGSADIPITPAGETQAEGLADKAVVPFDHLYAATSARAIETAQKFGQQFSQTPIFDGWARADAEGKPADAVKDQIADLIRNPDKVPLGVSSVSGQPGESWNQMAKPMFRFINDLDRRLAPDQRALIVTSGGNIQAIDAWLKAGAPESGDFDRSALIDRPYLSVTGKLFRLTPQGIREVANNKEPGMYIAEHAETAWNTKGNATTEREPATATAPVPPAEGVPSNREPEPSATEPASADRQPEPTVHGARPADIQPLESASPEVRPGATAEGDAGGHGRSGGGTTRPNVQRPPAEGDGSGPGGRTGPPAVDHAGEPGGGRVTGDLTRQTEGGDFRIAPSDHIGEGTPREKVNANLEAIRIVKALDKEGRTATPEEQEKLAKYVGWGAFAQKMFDYDRAFAGAREELESLLTPEEYKAARASTKNAHFTSPQVVSSMWDAMQRFGVTPGFSVIEPSMGVGTFFGLQPDALMPARRTGVELDKITGAIAKALYPDSNVQITGFEKMALPNDFFDVAISNVPFGNYPVFDPAYKRNRIATSSIHNYFFVKSLDLVRPGGIVGFITSRYTMDAQDPSLREMLASKADLVGMMRLPDTAFKGNAGTEVVTDVIFLRKRAPGETPSGPSFANVREVPTANGATTLVNEYYADHPEMLLGTLTTQGTMYGPNQQTLAGQLTPEILREAVGRLPENVYTEWKAESPAFEAGSDFVQLGDEVKDGGYSIKDGVIVQRQGNLYRPTTVTGKQADRIRGMIPVRSALRKVFETQLADAPEAQIVSARKELGRAYDAFVKEHGPLNNPANARALGEDPDYIPLAGSLEDYDRETKEAKKTDIFTSRTIERPSLPTHADTAPEALAMVLNERGRLDWNRMQELTGRTPDELREELKEQVFQNPDGRRWETQDEYLSGNVRKKLDIAEKATAIDPAFQRNVEALKRVQPADIRPDEIKITPGAPWIPPETVQQFVRNILGLSGAKVYYNPAVATWSLDVPKHERDRVANAETFGTSSFYGHELFDMALNGKAPRVYRDGPNDTRIFDPQATAVAQAAMDALKDKFRDWIWDYPPRADMLAAKYNKEVNNLRHVDHDGSFLTLPGSNPAIVLRPHQKNVIWRALKTGNTLLAHEVGGGKTWEMAGIAMEARRLGLAKKPMIAVPNHMAEQFSKEFLHLYPAARLLTIGKEDFAAANRKRAVSRIAGGNWDAVIIRHSSFEKIPVSDATYQAFVDNQIEELKAALEEQARTTGSSADKKKDKTVKEIEKAISRLEVKLQKHLNREDKDNAVTFEQLGVDLLLVDEAHAYKALPIVTRRTRVAGIPTRESNRATDMYMKTQYISKLNGGKRGVIFATGTPVTNTMAELYNLQRYLQGQALKDAGIEHFDSWANMFGDVRTGVELDVSGKGFRENTRFAKFINIPELMKMYMQVADVKTAEMMKLPRPDVVGGGPEPISAPSSPELEAYVDHLIDRAEAIRGGQVDKKTDNMLKVVSEGKKAALDMRLVDPSASDRPTSKVNKAVSNIYRIWKATQGDRATQIVFCDLSVPLSAKRGKAKAKPADQDVEAEDESTAVPEAAGERAGFSVYDDMRRKLINAGVPSKEIAFIHDYNTDEAKQELFDAVNAGRVRIVFGSTEKMGVGTNVQKRAIALHHMDAPWRPADIKQRDGRIQRQGNMHKAVHIYQYLTEGSFDAYSWQLLENKAAFIAPIQAGDTTIREMEDVGMMLPSAAEFKAMASGNPLIKEKIGTDSELAKLEAQRSAFRRQQSGIKLDISNIPQRIDSLKRQMSGYQADVDLLSAHKDDGWTVGTHRFTGEDARKEATTALHAALESWRGPHQPEKIGEYNGFGIWTVPGTLPESYPNVSLRGVGHTYSANSNPENPSGTLTSIAATIRNNVEVPRWMDRDITELQEKLEQLRPLADRAWAHEKRYADLVKRKAEIDASLDQSEAEKSAGAEDGDKVAEGQIEKGTPYHVRKQILLARERGETVDYQSAKDAAKKEATARVPVAPDYGKGSGPMTMYKPTTFTPDEQPVQAPHEGWYTHTIDGKPYYSDGMVIMQGDPPSEALSPDRDTPQIATLLTVPAGAPQADPQAFATVTQKGDSLRLVVFSPKTAIDADFYDYVRKRFPEAKTVDADGKVFFTESGKPVALVMGLKPDTIPPKVKEAIGKSPLGSERGSINIGPIPKWLDTFIDEDIVPGAKTVSRMMSGALDDLKSWFAPQTRGPLARKAAGVARERGAEVDQRRDRAFAALEKYRKYFNQTPKEHGFHGLTIWNAIETGNTQGLSATDLAFARVARTLLDARKDEMKDLGILKTYIENYLPREYKDEKAASAWVQNWLTKRPMQGSEKFRLQRKYPTMKEALDDPNFTLVPKFDNPVDMLLSKLGEMDQSITAHRAFEEMHDKGDIEYVAAGKKPPMGWVRIDDKLFTVIGPKYGAVGVPDPAVTDPDDVRVYGQRIMGHYYAPEPFARVLNNHLSLGIDRSPAVQFWRSTNNLMNMVQLTASYFHGMTTTLNSSLSDMALGVEQALNGHPVKAAGSVGRGLVPFASVVQDIFKGTQIQKAWDMPAEEFENLKQTDPLTWAITDALKAAGGKARQDMYYSQNFVRALKQAWEKGNYPGVAWRLPFAVLEKSMAPIMEYMVPRVKLGAFAKLALQEFQDHPTVDRDEMRKQFGQIWNSIDNRFGQLAQRNMMMHALARGAMNGVAGRPGWSIGSIQEIVGGGTEGAKTVWDAIHGRETRVSHKTAYLMALLVGGAVINGLANLALSHSMPHGLDFMAPRDGGVTEDGRPSRIIFPIYLSKDIYSYSTRPWATIKAKAAPILTLTGDLLENRDFNRDKIYGDRGIGLGKYLRNEFSPYSVTGLEKNLERGGGGIGSPAELATGLKNNPKSVLPFVGIMPAGKRVGLSKAEQMITEYMDEQSANTRAARGVHERATTRLLLAAKRGDNKELTREANRELSVGNITPQDIRHQIDRAKTTPFAADYKRVNDFKTAMEIYDAATPEEKKSIFQEARRKVNAARLKPYMWNDPNGSPDNRVRDIARKYFAVQPITPPPYHFQPYLGSPAPIQ